MNEQLKKLHNEALNVKLDSLEYWKLRATYLEKYYDPTYTQTERSNCFSLWHTLSNRMK